MHVQTPVERFANKQIKAGLVGNSVKLKAFL
jgi:hypothetical protein